MYLLELVFYFCFYSYHCRRFISKTIDTNKLKIPVLFEEVALLKFNYLNSKSDIFPMCDKNEYV